MAADRLKDWVQSTAGKVRKGAGDDETYLRYLEGETRSIRILIKAKGAQPYTFGIDEIYIPLMTTVARAEMGREVRLETTLRGRRRLVVGEPGAGKSTFLRRVAFELCRSLRGTEGAGGFLAAEDRRFPVLIRVADFARFLAVSGKAKPEHSPDWIPHYLAGQSKEFKWKLDYDLFERKLGAGEGECLVMMDGLDEAPDAGMRGRIARIFEQATVAYGQCDFW